jgi:hypothetical protein
LPFDDVAHRLGTAEDARLFGLFQEGVSGGESVIGKVQCEGPHGGGLQEKVLQKFTVAYGTVILLLEQSLFDSNFPGAADTRHAVVRPAIK